MKTQNKDEMLQAGATEREAVEALALFELLRPGLKVKRNGRVDTLDGDKTPLGLYRTISKHFPGLDIAEAVLLWAKTPGPHGQNPYTIKFVQMATKAIESRS